MYLLTSSLSSRTYVGVSTDPFRRCKQHNGERKGGARATRTGRPWKLVGYWTGFPDRRTACQWEWRMHHPPASLKQRCYGVEGRKKVMEELLRKNPLPLIWVSGES